MGRCSTLVARGVESWLQPLRQARPFPNPGRSGVGHTLSLLPVVSAGLYNINRARAFAQESSSRSGVLTCSLPRHTRRGAMSYSSTRSRHALAAEALELVLESPKTQWLPHHTEARRVQYLMVLALKMSIGLPAVFFSGHFAFHACSGECYLGSSNGFNS